MASTARPSNPQPKTRTISSTEARQHWGAMMKAVNDGEDVVVDSLGKPKLVAAPQVATWIHADETLSPVMILQARERMMLSLIDGHKRGGSSRAAASTACTHSTSSARQRRARPTPTPAISTS